MSLGILGLILVAAVVGLCWRGSARLIATAVLAVMLGVVIAGGDGPIADMAGAMVSALRSGIDSMAAGLIGGAR